MIHTYLCRALFNYHYKTTTNAPLPDHSRHCSPEIERTTTTFPYTFQPPDTESTFYVGLCKASQGAIGLRTAHGFSLGCDANQEPPERRRGRCASRARALLPAHGNARPTKGLDTWDESVNAAVASLTSFFSSVVECRDLYDCLRSLALTCTC